jgi:hypothetical protein
MKVNVGENAGSFVLNFTPETVEETALLVRFKINATKEIKSMGFGAFKDGTISSYLVLGKRCQELNYIK